MADPHPALAAVPAEHHNAAGEFFLRLLEEFVPLGLSGALGPKGVAEAAGASILLKLLGRHRTPALVLPPTASASVAPVDNPPEKALEATP